jgi:hypothetical protein
MSDESIRGVYEADIRARMKKAGITGTPALGRTQDGTYRRKDLERDFQSFKKAWMKQDQPSGSGS